MPVIPGFDLPPPVLPCVNLRNLRGPGFIVLTFVKFCKPPDIFLIFTGQAPFFRRSKCVYLRYFNARKAQARPALGNIQL